MCAMSSQDCETQVCISGASSADTDEDCMTVADRAARRRFIRRGSTFLVGGAIAGASLVRPGVALADCDRGGGGTEKKPEQAGNGSDADSGANADPVGCGRRYQDKPKISSLLTDKEVKRVSG